MNSVELQTLSIIVMIWSVLILDIIYTYWDSQSHDPAFTLIEVNLFACIVHFYDMQAHVPSSLSFTDLC